MVKHVKDTVSSTKKAIVKPIVDEYLQNMATTRDNDKRRISYERQEHSRPYGMHGWMLQAVLLDLILPLSGLLCDNVYAKSDPGWSFEGSSP